MTEDSQRPVALTVAGSDSGGGAGIQADLKTMAACGAFGTSAVTSVTAQNTTGVHGVHDLPRESVRSQVEAVVSDFDVRAAKTGMLSSAAIIEAVADALSDAEFPLVVDPVMVAESGDRLLDEVAERVLRETLLPEATLVTPNINEAEALTGERIENEDGLREAAAALAAKGPAALVTGGHLDGDPVDVLHDGERSQAFRKRRFDTDATHGGGCTLSAAIAASLARGADVPDAVADGETLIARAVRYGLDVGEGPGPVHHLVGIRNEASERETVEAVRAAVREFESGGVEALVPEVGMNVAVATPYATDTEEVAAVDGRIHSVTDGVRAAGPAAMGASSHVARLLLAAREYDSTVRAAANVRLNDAIAAAVEESLDAAEVDRTEERDADPTEERAGGTMAWTVERAMADRETLPDAIYDRGAVGKEAMCRLFARQPTELRERVRSLAERV